MYTAPAYFGILLNVGCFLAVFFVFRESTVGIKAKVQTENGKNSELFENQKPSGTQAMPNRIRTGREVYFAKIY